MEWEGMLMQPTLSPTQLRDAFRAVLTASSLFANIVDLLEEELGLDAYTCEGSKISVDLTRLYYDLVRTEPASRARQFQDHVAATLETARAVDGALPEPTRDDLIPTIKNTAWLDDPRTAGLVAVPFVGDLAVVYACDRVRSIAYASPADLTRLGVTHGELPELALSNLRKRLPPELSTRGDGKSFVFTAGGNIEASLVLIPEIWDDLAGQLPGDVVACVVARDVCLVTATGIPGGMQSVVAARDRLVGGMAASELISTSLLVRRGGSWAVMASN
jgi:hypothetical protein